jgi:hypothetical protein
MSALDGLAQFGLSMTNSYLANKEKLDAKKAAEEEKQYQRGREKVSDLRAQEQFDMEKSSAQIKLKNEQQGAADIDDERGYKQAYNQYEYSRSVGDTNGAINAIISGTNSNSKIPFKVDVERDETGKPVERKDEKGNVYYHQNVYDKDTGELMSTSTTTADGLLESFNKLENASEIAAANAAYAAAKKKKQEEDQSALSLYTAKKGVDVRADGIKAERDHIYKIDEMGVKHGYTIDELGIKHGYTIDLEGIKHANAVDLSNVNAQNNIGIRTAQSDLDAGGTPIVGGGDDIQSIINSLTGTESSGNSAAFRTNTDGRNFGGLIQMGDARLQDYANATGTRPITATQFKNLPAAQQRAVNEWHVSDLTKAAQATGAVGKVINGVPVTLSGLVAVGHLGGKGGMNKFVQTNGRYNPKDQLGTSLTDYLSKHSSGPIQVQRSVPGVPKAAKGSKTTQAQSGEGITNTKSYNANIDKGVNTALKGVKSLGIKSDAATTATFARAGTKLKEMGKAQNEQEFLGLYQEAFDLVIGAVPERARKNMGKADQNALGHKVLLSMVGASSLGNLKEIVYRINPAARSGGSVTAGGLTLPGRQAPKGAANSGWRSISKEEFVGASTPQTGKLQALYSRGLTPPKIDPAAAESFDYMNNLNDNMDW